MTTSKFDATCRCASGRRTSGSAGSMLIAAARPPRCPSVPRPADTPQAYAWDLVQMLKSTLVPSKKFIPDLTVGWPLAGSYRQTPEEFLLDVIVTAAAGCGGVAHWPGPHRSDATWYGIYEALLRIALVEDFYFDGKASEKISITGIPHNVRKIDTGGSVIELHGPDWRPVLMSFAHQLNDEYLLTVINYHELRDAFVEISSSVLRNHHLVDPVNKLYYACDDQGRAIVRVNAKTPVLLVATTDARRIEKCRPIDPQTIETQLDIDRREYLKAHALADIDLGRAGDIDVAFAEIEFGGEPKVTLRVRTPRQIVYFGNGGGRIYDWVVKGMPAFVAKGDFSTDGVGMDLLWLPAEARFSGDESTDMTLVSCDNDGSACRIVYEGEFKNALPGLLIRKEYKIQAQDTTVHVTLKLHNARSAEMEFSYWQHNVLTLTTVQFIAGLDAPECKIQGTAIFPVQGLSDDVHKHIFTAIETHVRYQ